MDERILSGKNFEDDNSYYDSSDDVVETEAVQSIDLNGNGEVDTIPLAGRYWTGVWKNHQGERAVELDPVGIFL